MKKIILFLLFLIFSVCTTHAASAPIYPNNEAGIETHILFGINQGLEYDEELGYSYIKLTHPQHVWFGNKKDDDKDTYTFQYEKEDFGPDITLAIEHSCDHEPFYGNDALCSKDWEKVISQSVGQNIALWSHDFKVSIIDPEKSDIFPYYNHYTFNDFFFSAKKLPPKNMIAFNIALFPERKLYNAPNTITLRIPKNINVIESYHCKKEKKGYHYDAKRLWTISPNLFTAYYYNALYGYTPLKKDFNKKQLEHSKFTEYELDTEIHSVFLKSILQGVKFCESDDKKTTKRSIFPFLFPNLQNLFRK